MEGDNGTRKIWYRGEEVELNTLTPDAIFGLLAEYIDLARAMELKAAEYYRLLQIHAGAKGDDIVPLSQAGNNY